MSSPTKNEIETIFNKLRSQATNKVCFDCSAKNPTWASVTYGVFICIDCSAVHRSLGVHLTFVRSTNLDTNWTWLQIRQMQVGGNANASQFFRQHNCNTADAQQKYNSRAAQLYRDKISTAAQNAMKQNGTKLHLDVHHEKHEVVDTHETDFFAECSNENFETEPKNNNFLNEFASPPAKQETEIKLAPTVTLGEPNVDLLNSVMPSEPPKSTIGVRKIQPKKSGLGAKKGGLGATKVKTNFADIEQRANMSDQLKPIESVPTPEQQIETVESVRLAYQDLSIKKSQEEEKMKSIDPVKAKQLERLGMGFNVRGAVSHSAVTDMKTISQESAGKFSNKSSFDRDSTSHSHNDSYDEYSTPMYSSSSSSSLKQDEDLIRMGFEAIEPIDTNQTSITTMFSSGQSSKSNSISQQPGQRRPANKSTREIKTYENDEAQKKFGNTKAISSDQFFGNDQSITDRSANLARFQGSNSISSSDFFNEGTNASSGTSRKSLSNVHFNAPDLDDVKESVRQGVTKVAGRLSSLANDVMSSIQDKYGY